MKFIILRSLPQQSDVMGTEMIFLLCEVCISIDKELREECEALIDEVLIFISPLR
jgi:hypothetical protein